MKLNQPIAIPENILNIIRSFNPTYLIIFSKLAFLFFLINIIRIILKYHEEAQITYLAPPNKLHLVYSIIITLGFATLLIYQATWQLAGFTNPRFMAFISAHDKRKPNIARNYLRGTIYDRKRKVLAISKIDSKGRVKRYYPASYYTAHLIGYCHPIKGLDGIEKYGNRTLTGASLNNKFEFITFLINLISHSKLRGNSLTLSIDLELQKYAYKLLGKNKGAIIVMNIHTGELLICVSKPSYNPNYLSNKLFKNPNAPLLNRAFYGYYPPGSVFKIAMTLLALENDHNHDLVRKFTCTAEGYTPIKGEKPIRDHEYYEAIKNKRKWKGHGKIGLIDAFAYSCNTYFAQLGVIMGRDLLLNNTKHLLFDTIIPIRITNREYMKVRINKFPELGKRDLMELARRSIGQGELLVCPFHILLLSAAIANDGILIQPSLTIVDNPQILLKLTEPSIAKKIRNMMKITMIKGTGKRYGLTSLKIGGKTGTAEISNNTAHSWFTAIVPINKPEFASVVIVENGGYGSQRALPITVNIFKKMRQLNYLK